MLFSAPPDIIALAQIIALAATICVPVLSAVFFLYKRRIRIKMKVVPGFTLGVTEGFASDKAIVISAANIGTRGTSLGSAYLEFPRKKQIILPLGPYQYRSAPDPYEFAPGKPDLTIAVDGKLISATIREEGYSGIIPFRASIAGVGGKRHKSKKNLLNAETGYVINKSLSARLKWVYYTLKRPRS